MSSTENPAVPVDLLRELEPVRAVAVLRADDTRGFRAVSRALVSAGVRLLEHTVTTPGALDEVTADASTSATEPSSASAP